MLRINVMTRVGLGGRIATAVVLGESIAGGVLDLARQPPFYSTLLRLGYPAYFTDILGTAKLLAAAALLAPGMPRLKEWAYAGIVFNMLGAVISHLADGDGIGDVLMPGVFAAVTFGSWWARQPRT